MSKKEKLLDAETLRKTLRYYPASGNFYWLVGQTKMALAGWKLTQGHIAIEIAGTPFYAHRLAWLYMTGEWPKGMIDHVNGVRDDNSFANLRDGPRSINMQNQRKAQKNNETGFLGVTIDKRRRKANLPLIYRATIRSGGKTIHLGTFRTPELAHAFYVLAKRKLHDGCSI